jgi:hypothetical protein
MLFAEINTAAGATIKTAKEKKISKFNRRCHANSAYCLELKTRDEMSAMHH